MTLAHVLSQLDRFANGEQLTRAELIELRARARTYARRLAKLKERHPDLVEVQLSPELEALLAEPAISA